MNAFGLLEAEMMAGPRDYRGGVFIFRRSTLARVNSMNDNAPTDNEPIAKQKLSPEDTRQFDHWTETFSSLVAPKSPNQKCVSLVNKLFESSPIIMFLNSELKKIGGCSPPITCVHCPEPRHGQFLPGSGIEICQNHTIDRRRMESTLAHEMMHAFDHCRFKFDIMNLKHIACSEVLLWRSG
jgi:Peptidase M76 family